MIYGVDVSNHQASFDFSDWDFAFVKCSEGTGFTDGRFDQHTTRAQQTGCLVAAYHFLRSDASPADQVATVRSLVPTSMPVIPDVESIKNGNTLVSAPTLGQMVDFVAGLRAAGYAVPLLYLPRWYWDFWGRPNLAGLGLPPLWNSWYPDYIARPREEAVDLVPASAWAGFGGLDVAVMQFTSTPFDQNAFPGMRQELNEILFGNIRKEEDMPIVIKGDGDAMYVVTSDGQDFIKRHIGGPEAILLEKAGVPTIMLSQGDVDAIPNMWAGLTSQLNQELSAKVAALTAKVDVGFGQLLDDEAKIVAEVRKVATGGLDVPTLAALLVAQVGPALATELGQRLLGSEA